MIKIAVIADDLTGATDTGIQFAARGLETLVALDDDVACPGDIDALVLDTDSRALPPEEAYTRVLRAVDRVLSCGVPHVYKKVDSTLRGNLGREIDAVLDGGGFSCALLAPAFPRLGRTTRNGVHFLYGVPVGETDLRKDPSCPVHESRLEFLLRSQSRNPVKSIKLNSLHQSAGELAREIEGLRGDGVRIFVFDAESEADLRAISALHGRLDGKILWAGSAGLAEFLVDSFAGEPGFPPPGTASAEESPPAAGPTLCIIGSMSAVTQAQTEALLSLPGMAAVRIDTVRAAVSERDAGDIERESRTAAVRALGEGRDVCLYLDSSSGAVEGTLAAAARRGMGKREISRRLTDLLGTAASGVLETSGAGNVILTGGETARAVCGRMGIRGIRLVKEVETGIPLGVLIGRREIRAVTKAGAFGTRTSLVHALRVLKGVKAEDRPVIALTMGDAAGIGPEIIMKVMNDPEVTEKARIVVIGDRAILERAAGLTGLEHLEVKSVASPGEAGFARGVVDCIDLNLLPANLPVGRVSAEAGNAAFHYLKKAADLAVRGEVDAICTAPLNKEALHRGGHKYPGHTELLAELTGAKEVAMMLSSPKLKVIHVTTHVGLIDAVALITPERVLRVILLADETLRKAGIVAPRIALCGINPHAGEHGLFGYREEEEKILPAVLQAVSRGISVFGPLPADTVFFRAVRGDFDIVVAMYHDQGHVPVKVLGFESGVNITLGLPVIRTSVDHGTAFDIAGRGIADDRSMKEALLQAVELAPKRV